MITDLIKYIFKNITLRFTRSFLTILSILIGIMSIFALISFGQGVSKYINDMGEEMGTDKLVAQPKGFGAPGATGTSLSQDDLNYIKKFKDIIKIKFSFLFCKLFHNFRNKNTFGRILILMKCSTPIISFNFKNIN